LYPLSRRNKFNVAGKQHTYSVVSEDSIAS